AAEYEDITRVPDLLLADLATCERMADKAGVATITIRDANSRGSATRLHKTRGCPRARIAFITRGHRAGPPDRRVDGSVWLCHGESCATHARDGDRSGLRSRRPSGSERRTVGGRAGRAAHRVARSDPRLTGVTSSF